MQRERVLAARRTPSPAFGPMGRDERVEHDGYRSQAPAAVARQLVNAVALPGSVLDRLPAAEWDRSAIYNFPERAERSLRWVAVHTVHEVRHHLVDVRAQFG